MSSSSPLEDDLLSILPPLPIPPADRRSLVVVDPSTTLHLLIAHAFQQPGSPVLCFADIPTALRALRQEMTGPVLLLLRERWWKRPAYPAAALPAPLDGWTVLRLLRQSDLAVRTILLLDDDRVLTSVKAQLAGACATLQMPFSIHALQHLVQIHGRV